MGNEYDSRMRISEMTPGRYKEFLERGRRGAAKLAAELVRLNQEQLEGEQVVQGSFLGDEVDPAAARDKAIKAALDKAERAGKLKPPRRKPGQWTTFVVESQPKDD